jgi:hypothetical protein
MDHQTGAAGLGTYCIAPARLLRCADIPEHAIDNADWDQPIVDVWEERTDGETLHENLQ